MRSYASAGIKEESRTLDVNPWNNLTRRVALLKEN